MVVIIKTDGNLSALACKFFRLYPVAVKVITDLYADGDIGFFASAELFNVSFSIGDHIECIAGINGFSEVT